MKASTDQRRRGNSTSQREDTRQFEITFNLTQSFSGTQATDQIICSLFIGVRWADHIVWKEQSHGQLALGKGLVPTSLSNGFPGPQNSEQDIVREKKESA